MATPHLCPGPGLAWCWSVCVGILELKGWIDPDSASASLQLPLSIVARRLGAYWWSFVHVSGRQYRKGFLYTYIWCKLVMAALIYIQLLIWGKVVIPFPSAAHTLVVLVLWHPGLVHIHVLNRKSWPNLFARIRSAPDLLYPVRKGICLFCMCSITREVGKKSVQKQQHHISY